MNASMKFSLTKRRSKTWQKFLIPNVPSPKLPLPLQMHDPVNLLDGQVAIKSGRQWFYHLENETLFCGGSLISTQHVLTGDLQSFRSAQLLT
jgi:hypothetical protein